MSKIKIITMVKKMADENMKVAIDRGEFMDYSMSVIEQTKKRDRLLFKVAALKLMHDEFGFGKVRLRRMLDLLDSCYDEMDDDTEKYFAYAKEVNEVMGLKVFETGNKKKEK